MWNRPTPSSLRSSSPPACGRGDWSALEVVPGVGVEAVAARGDLGQRVLADLQARANAPIFGMLSVELGRGTVGGRLMDVDTLSRIWSICYIGTLSAFCAICI